MCFILGFYGLIFLFIFALYTLGGEHSENKEVTENTGGYNRYIHSRVPNEVECRQIEEENRVLREMGYTNITNLSLGRQIELRAEARAKISRKDTEEARIRLERKKSEEKAMRIKDLRKKIEYWDKMIEEEKKSTHYKLTGYISGEFLKNSYEEELNKLLYN